MLPMVFSIDKNDEIMFKLSDGEIVSFQNLKFQISKSVGTYGWQAITAIMVLSEQQLNQLIDNPPIKVRAYTSKGYVEEDIADKFMHIIPNSIELILN